MKSVIKSIWTITASIVYLNHIHKHIWLMWFSNIQLKVFLPNLFALTILT